jgi:GH35 family endo-1,4-beta-xylanase
MRYPLLFGIALLFFSIDTKGQDEYHLNLQSSLQNEYSLPAGNWAIPNTEAATIAASNTYGNVSENTAPVSDQDFSQKESIIVNAAGANQWDAGYGIGNTQTIQAGSAALMVVWLRAQSSNGPDGKVSVFAENSSTYEKEIYLTFDLSGQWTQYFIPFDAEQTYPPGGLTFGIHLAWQEQTIEVGGVAVLNYGTAIGIEELPNQVNNEQYGGWEADAAWRSEAADRIEALRKANLTIRVQEEDGTPISGAQVTVEMLQHQYGFGSAIVTRLFANNPSHNAIYADKLTNLDGEGHGFNCVVFENAMKWPGWEQSWITTPAQTVNAVEWLMDRDIKLRGHNLVWPDWSNLPPDLEANQNNLPYIRQRLNDHIEEITTYPGLAGNIPEWDVLNEITTNRDLEYAFQGQPGYPTGREIYVDIFNQLEQFDPDTKTYINDYVTISQANTGGGNYDLKKQFAQELIDAGVQLDGIGFQAHIGGFPTSIYDVYGILDDFYTTFGTTAKITEYDTNEAIDDELAATYLRDFLTIVFSHPSTDGFLMWGFWDGAHWHNNAPMFYEDWTMKPAGQTFIDMVFDEWWTETSGATNEQGAYGLRGFKGKYKITIDCGDEVIVDTIELNNNLEVIKTGSELTTDLHTPGASIGVKVYPNPATGLLTLEKTTEGPIQILLYTPNGQLVLQTEMMGDSMAIPLNFGTGIFELVLKSDHRIQTEQLIIH